MSSIRVIERCFEMINKFPSIKFTLFVPIGYWRTIRPEISTAEPLFINLFPEFCKSIKSLPKENFEICYHGLFHGVPGKSDNDEFKNLSYDQAIEKFNTMFKIVEDSNLKEIFKPIFRPPAWRMSADSIRAAKDSGINLLALSPEDYASQTYQGEHKNFEKVVYFDCNPPFSPLVYKDKVEIVYHACEWDRNYLSKEHADSLTAWIDKCQNVQFCFIEELSDSKEN